MKKYFNRNKIAKLLQNYPDTIKLNIGCGTDYKDGWINIDNNSDENIDRIDLNWDLRNPLPFADDSVNFIFNEHFIEHLTVAESQKTIRDFMRVLKSGGVMRIAMPDMKDVMELYNDPQWKERPVIKNHGLQFVQTKAEMVNMSFSAWGHKWLYDWEELERRLKEAGCVKMKRCALGKSIYEELSDLETREGSLLIAEIVK